MATVAVEFKNEFDQVIQPGDEVVIVTTGYSHNVSTNRAIYVGRYSADGENLGGCQCIKKIKVNYWAYKETGEEVHHSYFNNMNRELNAWAVEWRANNPGKYAYYNEPEYLAIRQKGMEPLELKHKIVDKKTTLQLNRIYKLAV